MEIIHDEEVKEEIDCPAGIVGRIIGRGGETIRALQSASQVILLALKQRWRTLLC